MTKSKIAKKVYEHIKNHGYEGSQLYHVYGSYSVAKERAYDRCRQLLFELNGYNFGIVSHNLFVFTFGFEFVDKETGVVCYAYITPSYDYYCEI